MRILFQETWASLSSKLPTPVHTLAMNTRRPVTILGEFMVREHKSSGCMRNRSSHITVYPYRPRKPSTHTTSCHDDQVAPVPDLNDIEPFLSRLSTLDDGSIDLNAQSKLYEQGKTFDKIPGSYANEPNDSFYACALKNEVEHALAEAWKFDPAAMSLRAARENASDSVKNPGDDFTAAEIKWIKSLKLSRLESHLDECATDQIQARKCLVWETFCPEDKYNFDLDIRIANGQTDNFFSYGDSVAQPLNNSEIINMSSESKIATTWLSLPAKRISLSGQHSSKATSNSFKDSGICMDDGFAEASSRNSPLNRAVDLTIGSSDTLAAIKSTSSAPCKVKPTGPRQVEQIALEASSPNDNGQVDLENKKDAPYDFSGFCSSTPKSDLTEDTKASELELHVDDVEGAASPSASVPDAGSPSMFAAQMPEMAIYGTELPSQDAEQTRLRTLINANADLSPSEENIVEISSDDDDSECESSDASRKATVETTRTSRIPKQAPTFAQDLEHTIGLANGQVNLMTRALTQTPSPTAQSGMVVTLPAPQAVHHKVGYEAAASQSTAGEVQPGKVRPAPRQLGAAVSRTPLPHLIYNVEFDELATPPTNNLTPGFKTGTQESYESHDMSLEVELPSSPTTETRRGQNALGQYIEQTSSQANLDCNNNSLTRNHELTITDPEDLALTPMQADFNLEPESLSPNGNAASIIAAPNTATSSHCTTAKGSPALTVQSCQQNSMHTANLSSTLFPRPPNMSTPQNDPSKTWHPLTPFQLATLSHAPVLPATTPGTPTPTQKTLPQPSGKKPSTTPPRSKTSKKTRETTTPKSLLNKSVRNIFKSPNLGSRSPSPKKNNNLVSGTAQDLPGEVMKRAKSHEGTIAAIARTNPQGGSAAGMQRTQSHGQIAQAVVVPSKRRSAENETVKECMRDASPLKKARRARGGVGMMGECSPGAVGFMF